MAGENATGVVQEAIKGLTDFVGIAELVKAFNGGAEALGAIAIIAGAVVVVAICAIVAAYLS